MKVESDRKAIEQAAIEEHERMHNLYKTNRFMFEIEARKSIEAFINSAEPDRQPALRKLQTKWDTAMKGAGKENRLVVAKHLLMDHFINKFKPVMDQFREGD